jgi:hypothetical protein
MSNNNTKPEVLSNIVEAPSGLRKSLSEHGELRLVGSYALGLLVEGSREMDVDANLLVDRDSNLVLIASKIGVQLITFSLAPWHRYEVYDNRKIRRSYMPESVYMGLKANIAGAKYAADIWLFDNRELFELSNDNDEYIRKHLDEDPSIKEAIIDIKEEAVRKLAKLPSYAVYRAVIEFGVTNLAEYFALTDRVKTSLEEFRIVQ